MSEEKVIWVSKYALTVGIIETKLDDGFSGEYVHPVNGDRLNRWCSLKPGRDAFTTLEAAQADAEDRRKKKIASLQKQIKALEQRVPKVVVNQERA